ncbi:phosphatidylinositol-4- kinase [Actinomortierella ambigua]|uniref:1-phosphatidylinositol 4-kinase n=1 Tax=Actinomortierella ambigua TaxID=1343610 RepID=A0A9P6PZA7_9FUNG|nr:phosphatidylinositol-4- kinase [Actinomortierella ambigua]
MDSLEFDLHSSILSSLASVLAKDKSTTGAEVQRFLGAGPLTLTSSQPSTPKPQQANGAAGSIEQPLADGGVMTMRHQHALIAQAKFAAESSGQFDQDLVPRLSGYLHSLPNYRFSDGFGLKGKSPADSLTYNLTSHLLTIANKRSTVRQQILDSIWSYLDKLARLVSATDAEKVCSFVLPSLNGLLAALETSTIEFHPRDFSDLVSHSSQFLSSDMAEHVRKAISLVKQDTTNSYARRILSQYANEGTVLSSNRLVLQVLTVKRNMIGCLIASHIHRGALSPSSPAGHSGGKSLADDSGSDDEKPTAAVAQTNKAATKAEGELTFDDIWTILLSQPVRIKRTSELTKVMRAEYIMSLQFFADMRTFANELLEQGSISFEFYYSEIMGISLQLASLASVYIHEVDDVLPSHLSSCLFNQIREEEFWIHAAALDCSAFLALNFAEANQEMIALLQQFLTTPSVIFEGPDVNLIQSCAVERLAQSLKYGPSGEEMAMSTVYALLNTLYSHNTASSSASNNGNATAMSTPEGQSALIQKNVIAAIAKIAYVFKSEKITPLVLSMLAQQIRHHNPLLDREIVLHLTDIALTGSEASFNDITQILSNLSKLSVNPEKQAATKDLCDVVHECQLRLAKTIHTRPEFYHAYLTSLLKLFIEKGVQIQLSIQSTKKSQNKMNAYSVALGVHLPALGQLLAHEDFNPHLRPSKEDVKLFRDAWFHCVLFEFVKDSPWYKEWSDAIMLIARKTPAFVSGDFGGGANAYLEGDLEYNSVLPRGILDDQKAAMRSTLTSYLPGLMGEIKSLSSAKVVFLLSVYHVETMRSRQGNCSFILKYFMNSGINDGGLSICLEAIADQVVNVFISESQTKVIAHVLDDNVRQQVRNLIIGCAHRLKKVSTLSLKWVHRLIASFPQLMCDKSLLTLVLELSELLWVSCENELTDEYCPVYSFTSTKVNVTIDLPDSYPYRRELLSKFVEMTRKWIAAAMQNSPQEVDALLQEYLAESEKIHTGISRVHMGRTLAARAGKDLIKNHNSFDTLANIPGAIIDNSSVFFQEFSARRRYQGEIGGIESVSTSGAARAGSLAVLQTQLPTLRASLEEMFKRVKQDEFVSNHDLANALHRAVSALVTLTKVEEDLVKMIAWIPVYLFTPDSLKIGTSVWNWLITEKPVVEKRLMSEIAAAWSWACRHEKGLFSPLLNSEDPFRVRMEYAPSDKKARQKAYKIASYLFAPHLIWIEFLSSRFQATRYGNKDIVDIMTRLILLTFDTGVQMSTHPLAREGRFQLVLLGLRLLQSNRMEALVEYKVRSAVYLAALSWFELSPRWSFGGNKMLSKTEARVMREFQSALERDKISLETILSAIQASDQGGHGPNYIFTDSLNRDAIVRKHTQSRRLLLLLTENELNRLGVWSTPLVLGGVPPEVNAIEKTFVEESWRALVRFAWTVSPTLALQLMARFKNHYIPSEISQLLASDPFSAVHDSGAIQLLLGDGSSTAGTVSALRYSNAQLKYLLFWHHVPSITAISYFQPAYHNNPLVLQYAMRSLEHSPVEVVFFYVPQIVQALRHDDLGYVEKYIMRAATVSQLFAHQIIWNMKANMFKDNNSEVPDSLKPTLDRIIENIVHGLSGEAKSFYEREFNFFKQVTSISGTLMPLVKKTKPEKKKKIDEEMAKIVVDVGVYLPSNPDGVVVDIDKRSGRPLQSHAKTPFMATFKVRKTREASGLGKAIIKHGAAGDAGLDDYDDETNAPKTYDVWQSAIFKVGDDCRQDVLAIQLIAVFKNIFTSVGLDLYLFPYRIIATAPGCGMIDVIPNSISRDQLGREKVNNLQDYFVTKYGGVDSIEYQKARNNFIQSVAAYSVISYLLQFKDRHNGNIMVDDEGHIIHIDFGFILDISPGGINFESSPFKLTTEMVQIMGASVEDQGYRWFCELCVKAYLASRPYAEQIIQMVALMLESGLPCFRGETLKRLRSRFQPERSERQAADFMKEKVDESYLNKRTVLYDSFQKATNGIPY